MIAGWLPLCQDEDLHGGPVYLDDPDDCTVKIVCTIIIVNGKEVISFEQIGCDDDYWDDTSMTCMVIPFDCPMWSWKGRTFMLFISSHVLALRHLPT